MEFFVGWTQGPGVCTLLAGLSHHQELPAREAGVGKAESGAAHPGVRQEDRGGLRRGRTDQRHTTLF
jgi:hypothetical protein